MIIIDRIDTFIIFELQKIPNLYSASTIYKIDQILSKSNLPIQRSNNRTKGQGF